MLQFVLGLIPFLPLKPLHPLSVLVASHEFDSEQIPDLTKDIYIQDIHCVGSLCKLYFRELPNPLLTYQLYEKFSVSAAVGHFPCSGASPGRAQSSWRLDLPSTPSPLSALPHLGFLEPSGGCVTRIPSLTLLPTLLILSCHSRRGWQCPGV